MALAFYGKHPGRGDFLLHGLDAALRPGLEGWLDQVLAEARDTLGPGWEAAWDHAAPLCFWIGAGVFGRPIAGALAPSRDRVGRRFPLILMAEGTVPPPPVSDPDAGQWHAALCARLALALADPLWADLGPEAQLEGLPAPEAGDEAADGPDFWALRPGSGAGGLWHDLCAADHRRAAHGRSYWWAMGEDPEAGHAPEAEAADPALPLSLPRWSQVWAGQGLPSGAVLAWFLRGYRSND